MANETKPDLSPHVVALIWEFPTFHDKTFAEKCTSPPVIRFAVSPDVVNASGAFNEPGPQGGVKWTPSGCRSKKCLCSDAQ